MRRLRAHARFTGWIAVLAVLLASLLPTVGHALAAGQGGDWVEVCTAQGSRWVQAGDDGAGRAPASAHVLDHCPYCSLHAPALGLPPTVETVLPTLRGGDELPLAFLAAPRTLHAWASAQPRAPPFSS